MIVNCEKCNARYLLASLLLGVDGRKVRCGVCGHTWFQEPADEPMIMDEAEDDDARPSFTDHLEQEILEPIPEGVKPLPEGSAVPAIQGKGGILQKDMMASSIVGAVLFLIVFAALVAFRGPVATAWPPSARMFEMVGLSVPVLGEGLIFDHVKAVAKSDGTLTVTGNVINLHSRPARLPKIRATLRENESVLGDSWIIPMENSKIEAEETMPFTATYEGLPGVIRDVNLRFVLE